MLGHCAICFGDLSVRPWDGKECGLVSVCGHIAHTACHVLWKGTFLNNSNRAVTSLGDLQPWCLMCRQPVQHFDSHVTECYLIITEQIQGLTKRIYPAGPNVPAGPDPKRPILRQRVNANVNNGEQHVGTQSPK